MPAECRPGMGSPATFTLTAWLRNNEKINENYAYVEQVRHICNLSWALKCVLRDSYDILRIHVGLQHYWIDRLVELDIHNDNSSSPSSSSSPSPSPIFRVRLGWFQLKPSAHLKKLNVASNIYSIIRFTAAFTLLQRLCTSAKTLQENGRSVCWIFSLSHAWCNALGIGIMLPDDETWLAAIDWKFFRLAVLCIDVRMQCCLTTFAIMFTKNAGLILEIETVCTRQLVNKPYKTL